MIQNITDDLKNQGIELDLAQTELIKNLLNFFPKESNFLENLKKNKSETKGFYVWGDVGRGKTLIAKKFLETIKRSKGIFHYIDFMQDIHKELSKLSGKKNPLNYIAKTLNKNYKIIFIDEFQVEDVADAMIIGNLLNQLIKSGVIMFLTSNAHPNNLYKDGLQRKKFMDSMETIKNNLHVYELKGLIDYRTRNIHKFANVASDKISEDKDILDFIETSFDQIIFKDKLLSINSREFPCKAYSEKFLWISYKDFFSKATGVKDFMEICKDKDWIFVNDFIKCDENNADIIRRFISFIDICYREHTKVKFFMGDLNSGNLYSGNKLQILWDRCLSRLNEMQTMEYLEGR